MESQLSSQVRNPKWSRDEILLTLDFYFRHYPTIPEKKSKEIGELSELLRSLTDRLGHELSDTYRNRNGVYMKLMNLHHFNKQHRGEGLKGGSKLDEEVYREFEHDHIHLQHVSNAIRNWVHSDTPLIEADIDDEGMVVEEGKLLTRVHRSRERDARIIRKKKEKILRTTRGLACECCGFDFHKAYGDLGEGFIECHHNKPVSEMMPGEKTTLDDLSLVCSNCHRMIHRQKPWLSIEELNLLLQRKEYKSASELLTKN